MDVILSSRLRARERQHYPIPDPDSFHKTENKERAEQDSLEGKEKRLQALNALQE